MPAAFGGIPRARARKCPTRDAMPNCSSRVWISGKSAPSSTWAAATGPSLASSTGTRQYLGLDCVTQVVDQNRKAFATDAIEFRDLDAADVELPPADLLLVKDVLQHWSNDRVRQLLGTSKYRWVLVTNDLIAPAANAEPRHPGRRFPTDRSHGPAVQPRRREILLYSNSTYKPSESLSWIKKTILISNES